MESLSNLQLDAAGAVVTAGFWNCHVHLTEPVWSGAAGKPGALTPTPRTRAGAAVASALNRRFGAEVVKLFTGSYVEPTAIKPMAPAIAQTAVRIAHRHGLPVFAHTSNRAGCRLRSTRTSTSSPTCRTRPRAWHRYCTRLPP